MKTPWLFLFALFALLSLAACSSGGGDDDSSASDDDQSDDDAAHDDDAADDDTVDPFLHPEAKGPYLVGNTTFFFDDKSRKLSCGEGDRWLMTEVWYPAVDNAADWPENWMHSFWLDRLDEVNQALEDAGINPDDQINDVPTGSYRDAPLNPSAPPMPILVFSHGFTSNRFQNFTMADYLASHGYVVVAPDHICNAIVTLTPDAVVMFSPLDSVRTLGEREGDLSFLVDVFTDSPPEMFAGRLDNDHIGFWGHSFGGLTATEEVQIDRRASAMIQLAAFGFPGVPADLTAASMYFWGLEDKVMHPFEKWHDQVITQMPRPKFQLKFPDTGHFAFSDLCVFSKRLAAHGNGCGTEQRIENDQMFTNPTRDEIHTVLDPYAVAFFGAAFFDYDELWNYLADDHFPDLMDYYPER
jgi:dienelactone hydrolase